MTEFPRKGDRVRVVYEGVVVSSIETLGDVRVVTDTGHTILTGRSAKSIEVLERAYPNGTVAVSILAQSKPAVKRGGVWTPRENWVHLTDADVRTNPDFTVVHEPQAR